ncbi:MAG: hypothetical protein AVDCRST_MAG61-2050 [uncultured Friedmanniella sp.]|uniref:Uncharacterized protein n=1 Tax=uncultured Friedmanniella sp. TaxID=335381 RepID=A0A6J4KXZ0_9ACTN|nr:hypothetical protein [uncultured Friedmanniella sp.]CAA9317159.1 MAG: hypothetical protein AVDCRST_MAG61-2050 [uncultured Friedmanniella sp.]
MHLTLLGPQRRVAGARSAVAEIIPEGPVAAVNAGWRERESDTDELNEVLGGRLVNLELYRRWQKVLEADPAVAEAEQRLADRLEALRTAYRIRLRHALEAVWALQRQVRDAQALEDASTDALAAVRALDTWHLARGREVRAAHRQELGLGQREAVQHHRTEVARLLGGSAGLVVAGGHVGVLLHVLSLFGLAEAVAVPVITWSAGAMALSERVVLFHDHPPRGERPLEVHAEGLGLYAGVVPFPHARRRLRLDDQQRMALLAQRLAPSRAVLLPDGARLDLQHGVLPRQAQRIDVTGQVTSAAAVG